MVSYYRKLSTLFQDMAFNGMTEYVLHRTPCKGVVTKIFELHPKKMQFITFQNS